MSEREGKYGLIELPLTGPFLPALLIALFSRGGRRPVYQCRLVYPPEIGVNEPLFLIYCCKLSLSHFLAAVLFFRGPSLYRHIISDRGTSSPRQPAIRRIWFLNAARCFSFCCSAKSPPTLNLIMRAGRYLTLNLSFPSTNFSRGLPRFALGLCRIECMSFHVNDSSVKYSRENYQLGYVRCVFSSSRSKFRKFTVHRMSLPCARICALCHATLRDLRGSLYVPLPSLLTDLLAGLYHASCRCQYVSINHIVAIRDKDSPARTANREGEELARDRQEI